MPDLTILDAQVCASVLEWECVVGTHKVRWTKAPTSHPYQMWLACDCKGFQYRATCRHVKEAATVKRCNWGAEAFSGSPRTPRVSGVCPECGGPTRPVRIGV